MTSGASSGKVYLVGAGPGDPGLLTIKGKACLEQADVVLYDYLANPALLRFVSERAERIYVGRRGRGRYQKQEDINRVLIERAKAGQVVVRLKGGDPFVFGRGGEEAEAVAAAGIDFEVVPGVSAAVAVPAYAGIPVTHRTLASMVTVVTGHEDPSKPETDLDWTKLAMLPGTLVFLMGMKTLPAIVARLMEQGRAADTPVAAIRWGSRADQRTISGTLRDIVAKAEAAKFEPPTVIVIGDVVRLRNRLNWFERRPLFGKRIAVTRPESQAGEFTQVLSTYGAEPVVVPTIQIVPPDSWKTLDEAIRRLGDYRWLILTSVNGVAPFMNRLRAAGKDARALSHLRVCAIGPRTARELEVHGIVPDLIPAQYQAEGLLDALGKEAIRGTRVLIPRAEAAREILPERLTEMGARVDVIPVYRTVAPTAALDWFKEEIESGRIHMVTFTSSSTVRNFVDLMGGAAAAKRLMEPVPIGCIGPITADTAAEYGFSVAVVPEENTVPALAEAIVRHFAGSAQVASASP
ncbi:Porphyrin biosynthesis protein HemD [Nitrospira japonica]|uniref:uroporphyrinogen-III C-methyltransferase n=1 Tax=Nitrospira japonica TaxID=1325564 RepID=A0A1W1IAF1_9BACT|nr:uroporphyrinogen-III C-methyltransferase [Nitrospira japonica]SLM49743.1 Porphyrin biosynthesis protein HemD [Nitrospira japonica]